MKFILKLGILLLCLTSFEFLASCGKKKPQYYLFEGVWITPAYKDASGLQYPIISADSLPVSDHFFDVKWETNYVVQAAPSFSLIKSAYAFQFFINHISKASVTDVKVIAVNHFNAQYPAGSDVTPLINFSHYDDNLFQLKKDQFITEFNQLLVKYSQMEEEYIYWTDWQFKATGTPDLAQQHNFQLIIELDNGMVITEETGLFYFK